MVDHSLLALQLETLAKHATPAPWRPDNYYKRGDVSIWQEGDIVFNCGEAFVQVGTACVQEQENSALICLLRNHVGEIVEALRMADRDPEPTSELQADSEKGS